jgi:hypothetical protein
MAFNKLSSGTDPRGGGHSVNRGFSAKAALANSTAVILRASDIKGNKAELHVYGIRANTSRDIRASVLLDIEPIMGRSVFGLNPTNIMRLQEIVGDDLSACVGCVVTVGKFDYGEGYGDGLQILSVDEPPTEGKGKGK